ncbi:hypothetical protein CR513_54199, partial [Mucuna pruriens]
MSRKYNSWQVEKAAPIFQCYRFQSTNDCEATFQELKIMLASLPILMKSIEGNPILVYLFISNDAISATIIQEVEMD